MQKNEVGLLFHTTYKINSECKIVKRLEKNIGVNLHDRGLDQCFLDINLKYKQEKKNK